MDNTECFLAFGR
jgi:hypothetical protein